MWIERTLVLSVVVSLTASFCPHQTPGLKRWSRDSTWPGGKKPTLHSRVRITDHVLLDETPPELLGILIESTGSLVWSPDGDFNLTTDNILIKGSLHIGSEDCKFNRRTVITLTGIRGRYKTVVGPHLFGEKYIGVAPGGTLELHGQEKLAWTKLTRTVPKLTSENGIKFEHLKSNNTNDDWKKGLQVYVVDGRHGNVKKHGSFLLGGDEKYYSKVDPPKFVQFLNDTKDGDVVMIGVKDNMVMPSIDLTHVYEAVEKLTDGHVTGSGLIRQVKKGDAFAFVMQKGNPSSLDQRIGVNYKLTSQSAKATLTLPTHRLKFTVTSHVDNVKGYNDNVNFRVVSSRAAYPILNVVDDVTSWKPGDQVILTSTDYHWEQVETATVVKCSTCHHNQIQVSLEAKYMHWGEMIDEVDQRAEVALLSRNILIQGRMENTCPPSNGNCHHYKYDTYGGHIKMVKGFKDTHMEGVELFHMGQQTEKGFYPIHFHMDHDIDSVGNYSNPAWIRKNSIHHTFSRCVTVHGSHGATVQDNVGYDNLGHCYFLEDGGEKRTVFDGNLGVATRKGSILPSDDKPATFWMTSPQTYVRNNVAAGGEGIGIWFVYPDEPMGPSYGLGFMKKYEAKHTAIFEFNNNVAHSNYAAGLFIDNIVLPNEAVGDNNGYDPREDPLNKTSPFKEVLLYRLTAYKNSYQNAWVRGGLFRMDRASFADSTQGLTFARTTASQTISNSVMIGESRNEGEPSRKYDGKKYIYMPRSIPLDYDQHVPITGYLMYDGPVYLKNIWFSGFKSNVNYTVGAIGFHRDNEYSSSPSNTVTNVKFNFVDGNATGNRVYDGNENIYGFSNLDGDKQATLRDADGSLTGYPGATIVKPGEYYRNSRCYTRDNWNMQVCPQKFGLLSVRLVSTGDHGKTHPFLVRDDKTTAVMKETWKHSGAFPVTLGGEQSYTLHWEGTIPHEFDIVGEGIDKDNWVRFGVCMPRDGKFRLYSYHPTYHDNQSKYNAWKVATSIKELEAVDDGGAYFWDQHTGLMFFKLTDPKTREDIETGSCPGGCPFLHIQILSGNLRDGDCRSRAYGPYRRGAISQQHALHLNSLPPTASKPPKGWGAGRTRPFQTRTGVNGHSGQWGGWSHCSNSCGGGIQIRSRSCDDKHATDDCQRALVEHRHCNTHSCQKHAILG